MNLSEFYVKLNQYISARPGLTAAVIAANRLITAVVFVSYPVLLGYLFFRGIRDIRFLLIPAVSFAGVSLVRSRLHCKRPYELLSITPLIPKETKEKSFPSRHVFSAFMIAMTYLAAAVRLSGDGLAHEPLFFAAVMLFLLSDLLGDLRVFLGVHFIKDTVAGGLVGILCGLTFFL